ncbi:MAG: class I SAM-dependent DNA methyltransferase [Trueperaceae bacterium]
MRTVKPFSRLAQVYDAIMSDIDYEAWVKFILETVRARGWKPGSVLDLGCGTGNSTTPMFALGLEVMGLDASEEMLGEARAKLPPVPFAQGDFKTFKLDKTFSLVYSVFDSLNNLLTEQDFLAAARTVYSHLEPGGFFMFDANTTIGLRELWEAGRAEGWADEVYYRWTHTFDEDTNLAKVEAYCEHNGTSFTEVHFEKPYDEPNLRRLLAEAGFVDVEVITYPDGEVAQADEERLWVIAKRV